MRLKKAIKAIDDFNKHKIGEYELATYFEIINMSLERQLNNDWFYVKEKLPKKLRKGEKFMKKVEAYKTINNLLFLSEEEARICEKQFKLNKFVTELVDEKCWYSMDKDDIVSFILNNIDEIIKVATD